MPEVVGILAELNQIVFDLLSQRPCIDCGESDPVVLEFDHRDPATKRAAISEGIHACWSIEDLLEEIAKCDVRCANCHRRKTAQEYEHPKWLASLHSSVD